MNSFYTSVNRSKKIHEIFQLQIQKRGFIYIGFQAVMADVIFEMSILPHKEEKQCQDAHTLQAS